MEKCGLNTNRSPYACEGTTFCPSPPFLSASLLQSLLQKPGPYRLQPASHRYELPPSSLTTPVSGPRFAAELWATYRNYLTHLSPRSAESECPVRGPLTCEAREGRQCSSFTAQMNSSESCSRRLFRVPKSKHLVIVVPVSITCLFPVCSPSFTLAPWDHIPAYQPLLQDVLWGKTGRDRLFLIGPY